MKRILSLFVPLLLLCSCYNRHTSPELQDDNSLALTTIADLYNKCNEGVLIPKISVTIRGRVISSDIEGYFGKELYINDGSGTAKVLINLNFISNIYPEGGEICIELCDLALTKSDYLLTIGLPSEDSDNPIDAFRSEVLLNKHITRSASINPLTPKKALVTDLTTHLVGEVITVENLTHIPTNPLDTDIAGGYHRFCDRYGNHTYIYIAENSTAYGKPLPKQSITITGVAIYKSEIYNELNTMCIIPRSSIEIGM